MKQEKLEEPCGRVWALHKSTGQIFIDFQYAVFVALPLHGEGGLVEYWFMAVVQLCSQFSLQ